jgi:hypothetical protein
MVLAPALRLTAPEDVPLVTVIPLTVILEGVAFPVGVTVTELIL